MTRRRILCKILMLVLIAAVVCENVHGWRGRLRSVMYEYKEDGHDGYK